MSIKRNGKNEKIVTSETNSNSLNIVCDNEIKDEITEWIKRDGWKFEDFATFLELVGVKTPVRLSDSTKKYHARLEVINGFTISYKCITALNTEIKISIHNWYGYENPSVLMVTEGEETRVYHINCNFKTDVNKKPEVEFTKRIISRDGKKLTSFYSPSDCSRLLKLDETHTLKICIDEPTYNSRIPDKERKEILVLRNCINIEEYLLGLNQSLDVETVYEKLMELLSFSEEDISQCYQISLDYYEEVEFGEHQSIDRILIKKGKKQPNP